MLSIKQTNKNMKIPAVILTAGSEIVGISIAEALLKKNIPIILISLGKKSIIWDIPQVITYYQISWPPKDANNCVKDILNFFKKTNLFLTNIRFPIFPTDDSGLRFILENQNAFQKIFHIPLKSNIKMCGLDKAEFFHFLNNTNSKSYLVNTLIINNFDSAFKAFKELGQDVVFKPALKPLSMNLKNMSSKVITAVNIQDNNLSILKRLKKSWNNSPIWIAQKRLRVNGKGELSWVGIRTKNKKSFGLTVVERCKYPRMGGSACWVQSIENSEIDRQARHILNDMDFCGIFEMSFLLNQNNQWEILEFNPRPWLQIGLAESSGLPLIFMAYCDMLNIDINNENISIKNNINWVNPERLIISALSGEYGSKIRTFIKAMKIIYKAEYVTVYKSQYRKIKYRWLINIIYKSLHLIRKLFYEKNTR